MGGKGGIVWEEGEVGCIHYYNANNTQYVK